MARGVHVQDQMYAMIADWQKSGQTQSDYCRAHGVRYHVFHYWYKKYNGSQVPAVKQPPGFIALQFAGQGSGYAEVCFAGGHIVKFHQPVSADYLKTLIG